MSAAMPLPSFGAVETALIETTELFARELSQPEREPPHWSEFEWHIAQAAAAMQGISSLLSATLRWEGPGHWQAFLAEQQLQTLLRESRITALLSQLDARARETRIALVALKGAALLEMGLYLPGMRPMADIDLLVDPADADVAAQLVLGELGYTETLETSRHRVFTPRDAHRDVVGFGEHIDHPVRIELHSRLAAALPVNEVDITPLVYPANPQAGLNAYPTLAALMRHLLFNAAGDLMWRCLRLIQLRDIALLAARMTAADWNELLAPHSAQRSAWWAYPPLLLTSRYDSASIPASVMEATEAGCSWWLRRVARRHCIADVSWSRLRISAFPAMPWSRSMREAMRYATSRVWPSRAARSEYRRTLAVYPRLAGIEWYGVSRPRRIMQWLVSRPPRVETMLSVRSALEARNL